jgi:membrane protease YdiL (CAAX protease family)
MIFKGLQTRIGAVWALLLSSAMFGFFHITPYKMVTTALIGLWLGFLFWRSRSLWTSIYAHAFNNAVALAGVYAVSQAAEKEPEIVRSFSLPLPILVVSAVVFLLLLRLFNRINPGEG